MPEAGWDGLLVEVSAASDVVKQTVFRSARGHRNAFNVVEPLAVGGYLVGGLYCLDENAISCRALLLKVTAIGEIAWQRTLEWPGTYECVTSIDTFHDGSIYAQVWRTSSTCSLLEPIVTRWTRERHAAVAVIARVGQRR